MTNAVAIAQAGSNNTTFRNRIYNGAMVIDQRNAGASSASNAYTLDRWFADSAITGKYTVQQNSGSVTPPAGFANYLGVVSSSAYTLLTGSYYTVQQYIEGYNIADLAWGTASASSVTLSFWVRSSLTGTFGGSVKNSAETRSYPFTYTISSANTWEQKSITIPGDTSGTWLTTNGRGIGVFFGLGVGATYSGTASAWASANYASATGATSVVSTSGATFYITGVQLEKGSTATPFEVRPYGTELALCQRYCYKLYPDSVTSNTFFMQSTWTAATSALGGTVFPTKMRAVPTLTVENAASSFAVYAANGGAYSAASVITLNGVTSTTFGLINVTTASGGTAGQAGWIAANGQQSYGLRFEAEL